MSFFEPDNLAAVMNGQWVQRPTGRAQVTPIAGVGIDTRADLAGRIYFALRGENHDGHDFLTDAARQGAAMLVVDRDVSADRPLPEIPLLRVQDTRRALGVLAAAWRRTFTAVTVIAVTGSSGKTTTKHLIHSILREAMAGTCAPKSFNNDVGVPLTLLEAAHHGGERYVVVEVGTNAPGEIAHLAGIAAPDIAVITNIGRAHLEGLGTIDDVAREKASILNHLQPHGTAVLNADCPLLRDYSKLAHRTVFFGEHEDAHLRLTGRGRAPTRDEHPEWFEVNRRQRFAMRLAGRHNAMNALAAVAVARRLGLDDETIARGLAAATVPEMRMTRTAVGPIDLHNDAYNANPESMIAALETFVEGAAGARRRVIVLGDMLELGGASRDLHREVARRVLAIDERQRIDHVVLVGREVAAIEEELTAAWNDDRVTAFALLNAEAINTVVAMLEPGDALLLKGSRRMALERLIEPLRSRFAAEPMPAVATPQTRPVPAARTPGP